VGQPPNRRTAPMRTIRRLTAVLLALAVAAAVAACGERKEPAAAPKRETVRLSLDWLPNADHAGLYAAQGTGAFRKAGLDVKIQTPPDPSAPLKLLAAGRVDLAVSYEPDLLLARDRGAKLVAVGALVQKPLTSVVSIGRRAIVDPKQLAGKTVGTAGIPYQSAYLKAILARAGVNPSSVKEVNVGFNLVPAMLSGKVDATLGAYWNV
jgi:putative hydroxymethylpyrimidine transport system substrate-binding protein